MWKRKGTGTMALVVFLSLAVVGCEPEESTQLTVPGLSLSLADGWSYQEGEGTLLMTSRSGDLQGATPEGLRLWTHWIRKDEAYPKKLSEELPVNGAGEGTTVQVVAPPVPIRVDDVRATAIDLQVDRVRQRYIICNPGTDHVYTFVLEAPAGQWETALPEMERILDSVTFSVDS